MADNRIEVGLFADISDWLSGLKEGGSAVDDISEKTRSAFDDMQSSTAEATAGMIANINGLAESAKRAAEVVGLFEGLKIGSELITSGSELGEKLQLLGERTGITATQLSAMKFVSDETGVGLDQVAMTVQRLDMKMQQMAQQGGGAAAKALKDLGISQVAFQASDAVGKFELLGGAIDKFGTSGAQGARVIGDLSEVIGRGGAAMIPFLEKFQEGSKAAGDFGAVISGPVIAAAGDFQEHLNNLGSAWDAVKVSLAAALSSPLGALVSVIQNIVKEINVWAQDGQLKQWAQDATIAVLDFAENSIKGIEKFADSVHGVFADLKNLRADIAPLFSDYNAAVAAKGNDSLFRDPNHSPDVMGGQTTSAGATSGVGDAITKFFEDLKTKVAAAAQGAGAGATGHGGTFVGLTRGC